MVKNFIISMFCGVLGAVVGGALAAPSVSSSSFALAQASSPRKCPANRIECRPGAEGNGGCYEVRASHCLDGRVCPRKSYFCRRGSFGNGGCYDPGQVTCHSGLICPKFWRACARGRGGGGGCYDGSRSTCVDGKIARRR